MSLQPYKLKSLKDKQNEALTNEELKAEVQKMNEDIKDTQPKRKVVTKSKIKSK